MTKLNFGQPDDGIIQMAYVVEDIHEAMRQWSTVMEVGPWYLLDNFTGVDPVYRGEPCKAEIALAMSFAGNMNVELIQCLDDNPSVYKEHIDVKGYGFHHFGVASADFDASVAKYEAQGFDLALKLGVPTGGSVAYMDTKGAMPGYLEVIETSPGMEAAFTEFWKTTIGWDGSDPVRPFPGG